MLATSPGNLPVVRVCTRKTVGFSSTTVQKPDLQPSGGPNPAPYLSTSRFRRDWLDPSCPISGSAFRVVLFMVALRYPTVKVSQGSVKQVSGQGLDPKNSSVWFQNHSQPDPLVLCGPNPALNPSTRGLCPVWLNPLSPISGSAFRVFLSMVAFRYPTADCKILSMVLHCHFLMY